MILATIIIFIIASVLITHYVLVENYYDLKDVILTYCVSIVIAGLFGACVGFVLDFLFDFLRL